METTTTNEPRLTPMSLYSDRVAMPGITMTTSGDAELKLDTLSDKFADHQRLVFMSTAQKEALTRLQENPPATVGHLWALYLQAVAALAVANKNNQAVIRALSRINYEMNQFADDNDFCDSYEEYLQTFNNIFSEEGYNFFDFEGRKTTMRVTIQRDRTVRETMHVEIEVPRGQDPDYDYAYEIASDSMIDEWETQDEEYDTDRYDAIDTEEV
jgi:hypothetical protein